MKSFLETYGIALFTLVIIAILIAFAGPLGLIIKNSTNDQIKNVENISDEEIYIAQHGRKKTPTSVDYNLWVYIDKNNELVISNNKIIAPTDALLKEKCVLTTNNGLASNGKFDAKLVHTVRFATPIRPNSCRYLFRGFSNLTEIKNIENLYTDQCTDMFFMFYNCSSLKELNVKYFETSNVTAMKCMFSRCSSLKYLDLSSFDISKSEDCAYMMDTGTSTTIKANPDLKLKFNKLNSGTKITWE